MKSYSIIGFMLGAGAGVSAGYYIGKTVAEKKHNDEAEFKIEQIRSYYDSKFEALKNSYEKEKILEDDKQKKVEETDVETENKDVDVVTNEEIIQKCDYSAFSKKSAEEEVKEENMHVVLEPNEITQNEFWDYEDEGYKSYTVTYCIGDGVWFDEDERVIDDMTPRIGAVNVETFVDSVEMSGVYEEERWVRNEMCDEVFHIFVLNMTSDEFMRGR